AATPHSQITDEKMKITIDNFYDDAQFLIRFNTEKPDMVIGGNLTPLTGNLYSLEATDETVIITFK
ncbi:MAG: DUF2194 domain-containing protein, partial [Clostridia bacterium]|nr:DUF2194 domain-containing protein [Clostridia bacterium]